jgi:3-dehydroquinate synthase
VIDGLVDDLAGDPPARPLVIISDDIVAPLHAEPLQRRLKRRGLAAELLTFPHGEANKSRRTKERLENRLLELGAGREAVLVAVGGGVTGDLAGFIAATWHRGVPVVQVPTTMLAMADAAVGGKTAVNLPGGKNLVGCFHQPRGVYADVGTLATLDDSILAEGFAEVVKSAVVGDAELFRWLEEHHDSLLARDEAALTRAVAACIRVKSRVVRRDEREAGRRAILNFGHTVSHALEAATRFRVRHGRAVAVGLCVESLLAVRRTGFPAAHAARVRELVAAFGLPTRLPGRVRPEAVVRLTCRDKKARGGEVHYALPRRIGRMLPAPRFTLPVDEAELLSAL